MPIISSIILLLFSVLNASADDLIEKTIRTDSTYGSAVQARDMLDLMAENPGKTKYRVKYISPNEETYFHCNLGSEKIVRAHFRRKGGTTEEWDGFVVERLESAVRGGTLNDTPNGKIPGSFSTE